MKNFKELTYASTKHNGQTIKLQMYVPGINSGAYDKALHVHVRIVETLKRWRKDIEHKIFADVTLTRDEVIQLRDECNKILEL